MATAAIISTIPSSFVYEVIVSHVQAIQKQINEISNVLDERWKDKKMRNELKSHSLTFIDPYGNSMLEQYMDHQSIDKLIKQLKMNYVPKFIKNCIKIGTINQNRISPLTDCDLKSTVSNYTETQQFVAYGEVTLWIGTYVENCLPQRYVLQVMLMDNMDKIKLRIKEQHGFANVELRLSAINGYTPPNEKDWNDGTTLKLEDTIMSSRLYENTCSIMAQVNKQKVNYCLLLLP
jgi:hypothetical protein